MSELLDTVPRAPDSVIGVAGQRPLTRGASLGRARRMLRRPAFVIGSLFVAFWVVCAIFGTTITPDDPYATAPADRLAAPSLSHLFGTDQLGRDVLSRVMAGSRGILIVAPLATLLGAIGGTVLGLVTGYFRGVGSEVIMRVLDAVIAVPAIIIAMLALVAVGPTNGTVILVIGIVFTPLIARTVRAAVLNERDRSYVQAAELRQESARYILLREILPNVSGPIVAECVVRFGYAIFVSATLSFLGIGIQPPSPDWGRSIYETYGYMSAGAWWPVLFPALAIISLVLPFNFIADALTDEAD